MEKYLSNDKYLNKIIYTFDRLVGIGNETSTPRKIEQFKVDNFVAALEAFVKNKTVIKKLKDIFQEKVKEHNKLALSSQDKSLKKAFNMDDLWLPGYEDLKGN